MAAAKAKTVYILNGPNLNLLGRREPHIYGAATLEDIKKATAKRAKSLGLKLDFRQSNAEGELIDWVQEAGVKGDGLIINPGGLTHSSVALRDAVAGAGMPTIEVHLSNIFAREDFRHHSYISGVALGIISGLGALGYDLALEALAQKLK